MPDAACLHHATGGNDDGRFLPLVELLAARSLPHEFNAAEALRIGLIQESVEPGTQIDRAVELAERNWQRQREPADALLLAQAARASGRNDLLAVLRETVRTSGPHDARLARLMEPQ